MADDEDWGLTANEPSFSLFKEVTPEEEAAKDTFVDIVVYNRWSKAERRRYQRLKYERIANQINEERLKTVDDLANALESLNILRAEQVNSDPAIDELIGKVQEMKLKTEEATGNHRSSNGDQGRGAKDN